MTDGVNPISSSYAMPSAQSPQETKRMLEVQFETAVLGIFVAITQQNNSPIQRQISQVKNAIAQGQPPGQIAPTLNQIVSQMNQMIPGLNLPPFQFSSEGSQVEATSNQAKTLQKCLSTLSQNGKLAQELEAQLFSQLATMTNMMSQLTPTDAYSQLNGVISQANAALDPQYKIPSL